MLTQWFPGHMHKAQKEMRELLPKVDVIIEVLDARAPFSSSNPLIEEIISDKPVVRILNKSDLADDARTGKWHEYLTNENRHVFNAVATDRATLAQLPGLCRSINLRRKKSGEDINALIMGIPNVGKSTLINSLAKRIVAKTGNEPAITKRQQPIRIAPGFTLYDTPGILWPDLAHENISMRLSTLGCIRETVIDYVDTALFSANFLLQHYPDRVAHLEHLISQPTADTDVNLIECFGKHRGAIQSGGQIDFERAARLFVMDIRNGAMGKLTLELPEHAEKETLEIRQRLEAKREKKAKRRSGKSSKSRKSDSMDDKD